MSKHEKIELENAKLADGEIHEIHGVPYADDVAIPCKHNTTEEKRIKYLNYHTAITAQNLNLNINKLTIVGKHTHT